ncbi:MAG: LPS assembly lipoprotein LptE [Leptothrix ochracea]|jgi:LPS-assembly lipoprotein|uniref:LPS-assembly lipoprotein LptE n=1 Tax=Leptothrix ochracea TaxID=735331 RepID=UPI0034E26D43
MKLARRGALNQLLGLAAAGGAVWLSGCGFALKRPPELPFKRIYLAGFAPLSPMADELRRQLRLSPGVQVVEEAGQADAILESLVDAQEQVVVASTTAGQVRELTLRSRFRFRVRAMAGKELIPETELVLSRDMSYSETLALAKEAEKNLIHRTLQSDIAHQVLRRLAVLPHADSR